VSSKVEGRETTEGLVCCQVSDDGRRAALVKVASETDFAARSPRFVELCTAVTDVALKTTHPLEGGALLEATDNDKKTVKQLLDEAIVSIRENLSIPQALRLTAASDDEDGLLVSYVHNRVEGSTAGTAAGIVEMAPIRKGTVSAEDLQQVGKKLAMHIVAAKPLYLTPDDVPAAEVDKEREILREQLSGVAGKPPEILEKIVQGRLRKFYERICLAEQEHMIEEQHPRVGKVLEGLGMKCKQFRWISIP
jgi:elongation factor Ts